MEYNDIKELALSYADREDAEVTEKVDSFLRIVEARMNRFLRVRKMSSRAVLVTDEDQEYYGLPSDFNGLRDVVLRDTLDSKTRTTMQYLNPEQMNSITADHTGAYYAIIGNQLQIRPAQENKILEITYFQRIVELDSINTSNWMSEDYPDAYVFGLMVEISSFTKDAEAAVMWEQRFNAAMVAIETTDIKNRWSGTSLRMING